MKSLHFDGALQLVADTTVPKATDDSAVLHIKCAGICNTDLEILKGYMGFTGTLGHEFVGEVVEGDDDLIGKRMVGEINVACGHCELCQKGVPSQCLYRTTVGIDRHPGAFAEYLRLPVANLHHVPDNVSDEQAVFVEPLAAALQITEAIHIAPRHHIGVIGVGKLGALACQVLKLTGANVTGIVRRDKQAELLHQWDIPSASLDDLEPNTFDVIVDCTGNQSGFEAALDLVKPRGTVVLKSTYAELPQANLTRVVVDEINVVGSRCGPFNAAIRLLERGLIDVESLIEARYPLDEYEAAFEHAGRRGALKVLLDI